MTNLKNQDVLIDYSASGRVRPWKEKKIANTYLALAYDQIHEAKALRLRNCASFLTFARQDDVNRLVQANFCRIPLCPMCSWRRGMKIFKNTSKIVKAATSEFAYQYLFLTLTVQNCGADDLNNLVDQLMAGWNRFVGYRQVKNAVKGWYRGLEITHNVDPNSANYDTYHPHYHCILAINPSYFTSRDYLNQADWTSLWQKAMRLTYTPIVDVRTVKGNPDQAVAEIAKYAVKDGDYIIPADWDLTIDCVTLLDQVLHKRRLVAYGGMFKQLHKKLNLDDEIDGDLINIGEDGQFSQDALKSYYVWNVGYNQYVKEP